MISTFKPWADGIAPAFLEQEVDHLTTHQCHIYTAYPARGYRSEAWRQVKVTFIPKPGKTNYTEAMAYCPISLSSFMPMMEKLVDTHITHEILGQYPLHGYQFACQPGKSTETALYHVTTHYRGNSRKQEIYI